MDAPEIPAHESAGHGSIMDSLKHRYHGVPGYAIAGGVIVLIVLVAKHHGGSSSSGTGNPGGNTLVPNTSGLDGGGGGGGGDPSNGGSLGSIILPSTDAPIDTTPSTPTDANGGGGSTGSVTQPAPTAAPVPTIGGFAVNPDTSFTTASGALDTGNKTPQGQEIILTPGIVSGGEPLSVAVGGGNFIVSDKMLIARPGDPVLV